MIHVNEWIFFAALLAITASAVVWFATDKETDLPRGVDKSFFESSSHAESAHTALGTSNDPLTTKKEKNATSPVSYRSVFREYHVQSVSQRMRDMKSIDALDADTEALLVEAEGVIRHMDDYRNVSTKRTQTSVQETSLARKEHTLRLLQAELREIADAQ